MGRQRKIFLIDGYNLINFWPELSALADYAEARDKLVEFMAEYGAYEKYAIMIVFDALFTEDEEHQEKINHHLWVVYTGKGETADSYIERTAYGLVRQGREVHVVTSDGAEQSVILGAGAYRLPSKEFYRMIKSTKEQVRRKISSEKTAVFKRNVISDRIAPEIAEKLDKLRKKAD